jgi:regulator of protease activity HflC (stomatin/prohibitin superfamily)
MGQFLQIILDFLREYLVVWRVVYKGQRGCRWTLGRYVKDLKPGFYFFIPILQNIETTASCYQEVDTLIQTFSTADNRSVSISANVGYTLYNAAKWFTEVYNFDSTIERAIRGHLFVMLHALEYDDIRTSLPALSALLRDAIHEQATEWGVRIKQVRLTDFVSAPTYRVLNEVPNFFLNAAP